MVDQASTQRERQTKARHGSSFLEWKLPLALALVLSAPSVALSDQQAASQSVQADEFSKPIYIPPKNEELKKKLTLRARVGGTAHSTEGTELEVQALVPDHVGLTANRNPALNWFLSEPTTHEIRFTLADNRITGPLREVPIPTPTRAGIQTINLKELGVTLNADVQYHWYVSVIRNSDSPSKEDIVVGGVIERCELSECLTEMGARLTCAQQGVLENARAGFWYDAMGCLCNLIDLNPADMQLRRLRAALLREVGLNDVADWDLRAMPTPVR